MIVDDEDAVHAVRLYELLAFPRDHLAVSLASTPSLSRMGAAAPMGRPGVRWYGFPHVAAGYDQHMVRPRDVALGVAGAVVILVGPAPADIAALFDHPQPACTSGCGHTGAWWDRPVLVAHADELPPPPASPAPRRGGH